MSESMKAAFILVQEELKENLTIMNILIQSTMSKTMTECEGIKR